MSGNAVNEESKRGNYIKALEHLGCVINRDESGVLLSVKGKRGRPLVKLLPNGCYETLVTQYVRECGETYILALAFASAHRVMIDSHPSLEWLAAAIAAYGEDMP
jgi:hypothetical protein